MTTHRITTPKYRVEGDRQTHHIALEGILRLENTLAYKPILELMEQVADEHTTRLVVDLSKLEALNSSGINSFCQFLIKTVQRQGVKVVVKASSAINWQVRMLANIQRVVPEFDLEYSEPNQ